MPPSRTRARFRTVGPSSLTFKATGTDLRIVSAKLRKAGADKAVRRAFLRNLRAVAKPMVPAVRASIADIPSTRP